VTDGRDPYAYLTDPDVWSRSRCGGTALVRRNPRPGEVVGWRYSAWTVTDVRVFDDVDLVPAERAKGVRPYDVELQHLAGPALDGQDRLVVAGEGVPWRVLGDGMQPGRFRVCSCHGHPWPCQSYDRDVLASTLAAKLRRELAGAEPGTCAACREPVRARQSVVRFPEPSLIVPGAPGPTFHAQRRGCWWAAYEYETKLRIPALPTTDRIASCPGAGFIHGNGLWFECTAGPACTGLHGPYRITKNTGPTCATRTYTDLVGEPGYKRPLTDCGYRPGWGVCLGAETGSCRPSGLAGTGLLPESYQE